MAVLFALGAVPAHAAEDCRLTKISEIPLAFDAWGRPLVDVSLNGEERLLLVDTGGVYGMLERATADALGLRTYRGAVSLMNVEGVTSNDVATVREVRLGALLARDRPFVIDPGDDGTDSAIHPVGVIAPDILANYDIDFDFANNVMNIFRQDRCEGQVVYWHPDSIAIIPFELDQGSHITFEITLDGIQLTAMLDTGAASSVINRVIDERRFGLDFSSGNFEAIGTLGDSDERVYRHTFEKISFEGIEINRPVLNVLPDLMTTGFNRFLGVTRLPEVIIGMPLLAELHVYIAYGERKLYITAAE